MNKEYYVLTLDEYGPSVEDRDEVLQELSDQLVRLENKIDYIIDLAIQNHDNSFLNILEDEL